MHGLCVRSLILCRHHRTERLRRLKSLSVRIGRSLTVLLCRCAAGDPAAAAAGAAAQPLAGPHRHAAVQQRGDTHVTAAARQAPQRLVLDLA